jgi:FAD:protein FMN transferase
MKRFVVLLLLAPMLAAQGELLRHESSIDAMGTTFTVAAYGDDRQKLITAVDLALEEARRLDHKLSNYRPESEWSEVNRLAAERPVTVSPELFRLLAYCVEVSRESEGTFDITVGPLMRVWGFYKGSGHLPHRAEVRGSLVKVGYKNILLDPQARTVRFARRGVEIDPGGVGKGYAVDRMAEILKENGIRSAFITAGGSSMIAIGTPPGEPGWKVQIRNPKEESKIVAETLLKDESMATSGNYEKFFRVGRRIYSHIMDPRTGFPSEGMYSVSVIAPLGLDSEVWAKPYYILGRQWAAKHNPKKFRIYTCEDKGEPVCAWLQ